MDEVLGRKEMALFSRDLANDFYDLLVSTQRMLSIYSVN